MLFRNKNKGSFLIDLISDGHIEGAKFLLNKSINLAIVYNN